MDAALARAASSLHPARDRRHPAPDDQQIAVGRVVVAAHEPSPLRIGLQKPVDGPSKPVASVIRLAARSAGVQSLTPLADRMRRIPLTIVGHGHSMAAPLRGWRGVVGGRAPTADREPARDRLYLLVGTSLRLYRVC